MNISESDNLKYENLVNNMIINRTEFNIDDFTGGSVQISSTYNKKLSNYKLSLFFGYKSKKPITRTFEIEKDSLSIWLSALYVKTTSIINSEVDINMNDIEVMMNSKEVDSNKVISISKVEVPLPVDLPVEKKISNIYKSDCFGVDE